MNFRKLFCKLFNDWKWFRKKANCQRYDPKPAPTPEPQPEPPKPKPEEENVYVNICTSTGLKINPYCPVVTKALMQKSRADKLGICTTHKKPIPLPDQPKDCLLGTSFYQMLESSQDGIIFFLDGVRQAGGNCTEIFASYTWSKGKDWQPFLFTWTVDDKGQKYRLYDLTKWNEDYWLKLEFIMKECKKRNLTLIVRMLDYCSVKNEDYYKQYCWHTNKQKQDIQNHGGAWGGFYGPETKNFSVPFLKRIKDKAKSTGCQVKYQWCNEPGYKPNPGEYKKELEKVIGRELPKERKLWSLTPEESQKEKIVVIAHNDKVINKELEFWIKTFKDEGIPIFCQSMGSNLTKCLTTLKENSILWEIHGCNSPDRVNEIIIKYGSVVATPNGDGPDPKAKGRQGDVSSKREPSMSQAAMIGVSLRNGKGKMFSFFNRNTENPLPADIKRAKFDVLGEIVRNYNKK